MMTMFGFIIPDCLQNKIHKNQLSRRCIDGIRLYHDEQILLINDSFDNYNIYQIIKKLLEY